MPSTIAIKWQNVNCFEPAKGTETEVTKSLTLPLTVNARIVNRIERKVCHADL